MLQLPEHDESETHTQTCLKEQTVIKAEKELFLSSKLEQLASYNNASECSISSTASTRMVKFQKEVNDIRAERIAKSANPLALLAAAQPYSDNYYQAPKLKRSSNITPTRQRHLPYTRQ
ncbi:hypothetical protein Tco_0796666 [Tanacetum coccineum]